MARAQQMPSAAAQAALRSQPLTLSEGNFPDGYVGLPFGGSVMAMGGSGLYSVIVGGNLPPGTYLESGGGVVTLNGVPTQAGTYEVRVGVTDLQQGGTRAQTYTLRVLPQLLDPRGTTVTVSDAEGFKFADADSVFFPAKIADAEGFKFNDADSVFMPAHVSDAEGFTFKDTVSIFGPDKPADPENFKFGDNAVVMLGAMIGDAEGFKFGDNDVVKAAVGVSPSTAPAGTYNTPYSQVFTAAGNTGAVTLTPSGTIPGLSFTAPASSTTLSGTPTAAGTYSFSISAHDSANTDVVSYSLTINKAAQSINLGALPTPTYGGANFTLSGSSTSGAAVTFASTSGLATGSNPFTPAGAGTASFTASAATTSNYNAGTLNFNVSIAKAMADVAVPGVTRAFDQPNPSFSYSLVGFVNGDTASVASGAPVISTAATPLSPVSGSPYAINIALGTLTAANYNFGFASGGLTVTKAAQTVTFYPLPTLSNGMSFPLSARASSGLAVTYAVSGPASISNNVLSVSGSGLVQVTASQTGNGNYNAATPVIRSFTAP
jgi:hypothetical protein